MKIISKLSTSLVFSLILFGIGISFCLIDPEFLRNVYFQIMALLICITGIIKLTFASYHTMGKTEFILDVIEGIIDIIVGVCFANFMEYFILDIIFAGCYILIPIVRFFFTKRKMNQFIIDIFKYYILVTILCSSQSIYPIFFVVIGIIHMVIAIVIIIYKFFQTNKRMEVQNNEQSQ